MPAQIHYEINSDKQYLVVWSDSYDKRSRLFMAGDGVGIEQGERPPETVKHTITSWQMVELLDALLAYGVRPSSNAWSVGHVSDLKAHIAFAEKTVNQLMDKVK